MRVEPFEPWHLELIAAQGVQGAQLHEVSIVPVQYAKFLRPAGPAVTAFHVDHIVMCGGIIESLGIGTAWAVLASDAGRHMLWLHRATERFLEMQHLRRIEATVEKGFSAGCRWAELLGFRLEGEMAAYGPNRETHLRYGRT